MFTGPEIIEMKRLTEAGIGARAAIVAMEGILATEVSPTLRPILAETIHPILECIEGTSNALGNFGGAICQRDERAKVKRRLASRDVFLADALQGVNDAIDEGEEGLGKLEELLLVIPASSSAVKVVKTNLSRTVARLRLFDQSLPYEDPLCYPKMTPILERDLKTDLWRSSNQYLYDALAALIDGYSADPLPMTPQYLYILQTALKFGWDVQDDLSKVTYRAFGVPYEVGEDPIPTSLWTLAGTTSNRWQFCMTNIASLLTAENVKDRPLLEVDAVFALAKGTDAWKRADYVLGLLPVAAGWMPPGKPFGT